MKTRFKVYCAECAQPILSRGELVVALKEWRALPFHAACHARLLKGKDVPFFSRPLNSRLVSVAVLVLAVIGGFLMTKSWIGIFFFAPLIFRLYSWSKFESLLTLNQMEQEAAELDDTVECAECRYPLPIESTTCPNCGWTKPQPPPEPTHEITSTTNTK